MKCPACTSNLRQYRYHELVVDICPSCGGIWFDPDELGDYIRYLIKEQPEIPGAAIELKKAIKIAKTTEAPRKLCPRCQNSMDEFNYAYDSNILLDKCPECKGVWADGNEILALATFIKGNPTLAQMGRSLIESKKRQKQIEDLAQLGATLSSSAWPWFLLPKIILPLRSDARAEVIPAITIFIILLNILVFLYQTIYVEELMLFFRNFGMIPSHIMAGQCLFTIASSMFIHISIFHLLGNMLFLWVFGWAVEGRLGHLPFLLFYLVSGMVADLADCFSRPDSIVPAIGSSGAIAGIMGAFFVLLPRSAIKTFFINQVVNIPAYLFLGTWILMQIIFAAVYWAVDGVSGIGWFAHIGGFSTGAVLMIMLKIILPEARSASQ